VVPTRSLGSVWKHVGYAAATVAGLGVASFLGRKK
jgi:formate dehydrogenase iron-sulfur subunit